MYNRYIRNDAGRYERIPVDSPPPSGEPGWSPPPGGPAPSGGGRGVLSGILEKLHLQNIDTGDLMLIFLLLLLFREGEDEELLMALGLLLIL